MSTASIGNVASSTGAASPGANGLSAMSSGQFLQIMLQELQNQDPLSPQDTSTLMNEIGSLNTIQSQSSLQSMIQSLVTQEQIGSAGNLIGKMVAGLDANNNQISGKVTSVLVQNGQAMLQLDNGSTLAVDHVTQIANPTADTAGTNAGTAS